MAEIGARLRDARMRLGIDINEVEVRTKIRAKYLRAMENEEWDLLPGDVYVRSFLRSYADFLGLDSRGLLDDFRREYDAPADHEPPPIVPPSRQGDRQRGRGARGRRRGIRVAPWLVTGLVLVVVVAVLFLVGSLGSSRHGTAARTTATTTRVHQAPRRRRRRKRVHRVAAAPHEVRLSLVPTGTVYVCLTTGSGRRLIPGRIYAAGETIPTESGSELLLTLGNAAVTVRANGVAVPVAASGTAIGLRFTPGHHAVLPATQEPTCT